MIYKILTVDDSRTIRQIVKNAFKNYACELLEAENGRDGLTLAMQEQPDLIILDITMPVMTGIEMLAKLMQHENLKNTPVIMLTAESGRDIVMNIVKMGARDYIVKPFKGEQLIERVKLLLALQPRIDGSTTATERVGLFSLDNDVVIVTLPARVTRAVITEVETAIKEKISQMTTAGTRKIILNVQTAENLNMAAIQLIIAIVNNCARAKLRLHLVAGDDQINSIKGFKETSVVPIQNSIEQAKAAF